MFYLTGNTYMATSTESAMRPCLHFILQEDKFTLRYFYVIWGENTQNCEKVVHACSLNNYVSRSGSTSLCYMHSYAGNRVPLEDIKTSLAVNKTGLAVNKTGLAVNTAMCMADRLHINQVTVNCKFVKIS